MRALGYYTLDEDVINPTADRRMTTDWTKAAVFKKGTPLRLFEYNVGRRDQPAMVRCYVRATTQHSNSGVNANADKALFAAFENAQMSPRQPTMLERVLAVGLYEHDFMAVLEFLAPTDEQLAAAAKRIYDDDAR